MQALKNSDRLALDLRPDYEESKMIKEQSEFTLVGHSGPVFSVSISLDDKFISSMNDLSATESQHYFTI